MKVKNCSKCGSINFIKKGINSNGKQKYFCLDCKKYFQIKTITLGWVKKAYKDYTYGNMIYRDLVIKYKKSIPTLTKYFDLLNKEKNNNKLENIINNKSKETINSIAKTPINLVFDATFLKI
jgi:hypothetical protein